MEDDIRVCVEVDHFDRELLRLLPDGTKAPYRRIKVNGPTDHCLRVRSVKNSTLLVIEGSFIAYLQGHNVVGTMELLPLVVEVVNRVLKELEIKPSPKEQKRIDEGRIKLERLDVVG